MARTLRGNYTGRAAVIARRELLEDIARQNDAAWLRHYNQVASELMAIDPDLEAWFWDRPEQTKCEMLPLMEERLASICKKINCKHEEVIEYDIHRIVGGELVVDNKITCRDCGDVISKQPATELEIPF